MKGSWNFFTSRPLARLTRRISKIVRHPGAILFILLVLVIFAALVLPDLGDHHHPGRFPAAKSQISTFDTALDMFETDTGRYPTTAEGLAQLLQRPADAPSEKWNGPYLHIDTIPLDPWKQPYRYLCPGVHNTRTYDIVSAGPDGEFGTADDIANYPIEM